MGQELKPGTMGKYRPRADLGNCDARVLCVRADGTVDIDVLNQRGTAILQLDKVKVRERLEELGLGEFIPAAALAPASPGSTTAGHGNSPDTAAYRADPGAGPPGPA